MKITKRGCQKWFMTDIRHYPKKKKIKRLC